MDAHNLQALIDYGHRRMDREVRLIKGVPVSDYGDNVVSFDPHRRPVGSGRNQGMRD